MFPVSSHANDFRPLFPGMGEAVAKRTVLRRVPDTTQPAESRNIIFTLPLLCGRLDLEISRWLSKKNRAVFDPRAYVRLEETSSHITVRLLSWPARDEEWGELATRVAYGNTSLVDPDNRISEPSQDYIDLRHHISQGSILLSGRHLQHGDATQNKRRMELFTNCSTSAISSLLFTLLLSGSGVGTDYSDHLMAVDWAKDLPIICPTIDDNHPDVLSGEINARTTQQALEFYSRTHLCTIHTVEDSREGWGHALRLLETMTFRGVGRDQVLILDFSHVRERGSPIAGLQGRPASGPGPLMVSLFRIAELRDSSMKPWKAKMYVDHYLAECVLVGGARRAARMATKFWKDEDILEFIAIKEHAGLWSANNSVLVDAEFWKYAKMSTHEGTSVLEFFKLTYDEYSDYLKAKEVYEAITKSSYYGKKGEPGVINVDKLEWDADNINSLRDGFLAGKHDADFTDLMDDLFQRWISGKYQVIVNPCGEILLSSLGGYCVIGDVAPYLANFRLKKTSPSYMQDWDAQVLDSVRVTTRALIRTNLMDSMYDKEVQRTNRIGVSVTGVHEYALARFGYNFYDLLDEEKSKDFWMMLARMATVEEQEARSYSAELGVAMPHTGRCGKPAGTISKMFGLTEGWNLAPRREYVRWVQFRTDSEKIEQYKELGYPTRDLTTYKDTTIVGFPTQPLLYSIPGSEDYITAPEATPEENYRYLQLIEKYWLSGQVNEAGELVTSNRGNQISYTLKYASDEVSYESFCHTFLKYQPTIRCCSVAPMDEMDYEYLPEESVTKADYERLVNGIKHRAQRDEEISREHVLCDNGACPVDFRDKEA